MAEMNKVLGQLQLKQEDVDALHSAPVTLPKDSEAIDLPRLSQGGDSRPDVVVIPQIKDIVLRKRLLNAMSGDAFYFKDKMHHVIEPVCIAVSKSHKAVGDDGELITSDRLYIMGTDGFVYQTTSDYAIDAMRRIIRVLGAPGVNQYKLKIAKYPNSNAITLLVE